MAVLTHPKHAITHTNSGTVQCARQLPHLSLELGPRKPDVAAHDGQTVGSAAGVFLQQRRQGRLGCRNFRGHGPTTEDSSWIIGSRRPHGQTASDTVPAIPVSKSVNASARPRPETRSVPWSSSTVHWRASK